MTDFDVTRANEPKLSCTTFPCQANAAGWCPKCDRPTHGTVLFPLQPAGDEVTPPLELARWVKERAAYIGPYEQIIRALCTRAAVDEARRSAESDQDYMDGLSVLVWIERRADELYAQIVGK